MSSPLPVVDIEDALGKGSPARIRGHKRNDLAIPTIVEATRSSTRVLRSATRRVAPKSEPKPEAETAEELGIPGAKVEEQLSDEVDRDDGTTSAYFVKPEMAVRGKKRKQHASTSDASASADATVGTTAAKVTAVEGAAAKTAKLANTVPKRPKKAFKIASTPQKPVREPPKWREQYDLVKQMRTAPNGAATNAAVDTMGCERLADHALSPRTSRFHTLVALMLSSQTKDTVNAATMQRLRTELPAAPPPDASTAADPANAVGEPGLTLENMLAVSPERLNELIRLVGFHNNKTRYLKQTAEILRDQYNGDIPDTIEGLVSLPGVGPKMAHLCMSAAWDRTVGIGVDVHVHRITNLWGWHSTRTPEATRLALESWLPRDRWREINWLLVGFGQTVCTPVAAKCGRCELGLQGLCKAADRKKVNEGRKLRKAEEAIQMAERSDNGLSQGRDSRIDDERV